VTKFGFLTLLIVLGAAGCGPKTSLLTDQPQHPESTYYFATLSKRQGRAVERLVPEGSVITRQSKSGRDWIYIINDPGVATGLPRFEFKQVDKCEIRVQLHRLSDMAGRGIDAGEVRRRDSFVREFKGVELVDAVKLLQTIAANPFDAAKKEAPEAWESVAQSTQVDDTEVGFVVSATAEVITGNPFDTNSRMTLYTLEAHSPYQRASDAK
jgi:hypothetical protein